MIKVGIIYASLTGNTKFIANIIANEFKLLNNNINIIFKNCTNIEPIIFKNCDICIIATYTYGDGDLPEEIIDFYKKLKNLNLKNKIYGVCGTGDIFYEKFCKSVDDFDLLFKSINAIKGTENIKINIKPSKQEIKNLKNFSKKLIQKYNKINNI